MLWVPSSDDALQVRFWGVRGSLSTSGRRFCEFGGHTPCVEVRCGPRLFIVDAGTGLAALGASLGADAPREVDILLSHLHLDHVGGLPFFKPAILGDRTIHVRCGSRDGDTAEAVLDRLFAPPLFPLRLDQLPARIVHHGFKAGETLSFADGHRVETHALNHPDGCAGFRFAHRGRSFCYISDIEHTDPWPDPALVAFVAGADLVLYDGMFSEADYNRCKGWGHSTWQKGVELAQAADVGALGIFHLYPQHDDAYLRGVEAEMKDAMPNAFIAREGRTMAFVPVL